MSSILKKVDHGLDIIERNCVGYATIIMVAVMFVNVVLRNFFQSGLVWGNELSSYLNIFAVYIAVSAGFKYGSHVGISVVVDYLVPKVLKKWTAVLSNLISFTFCLLIIYLGIRMVNAQMATGQCSPVLSVPLWVIYSFLAFGIFLSAIRLLIIIIGIIIKKADDDNDGGGKVC
jgi:C4-dicarboxylate transporter DctQ subunit